MPTAATNDNDLAVRTSGPVTSADIQYARRKIAAIFPLAPRSVLFAKADLVVHGDPAREHAAFAKAELDLDGRFVRAHATGSTVTEAVDALEARLRERLERDVHRQEAQHLRHRDDDRAWHHGNEPARRRSSFPRPADEREIVRRKTFAVKALTPGDASVELEALDHDFYLFENAVTGDDNVLFRTAEGAYELIEPVRGAATTEASASEWGITVSAIRPSEMSTDEAIELLDLADEPFVFFLDATSGRGQVVYLRYDGHYGLIVPATPG